MAQPTSAPETDIDAGTMADAAKFETILARYLAGEIEEDAFRIFRLNNGIYGQRQGGHNQMVRIKIPYGGMLPDQLELMADLGDEYSRGWGHITTRQNIQFHYVQLEKIPEVMRRLARSGMTTREACGDTVRNVQGCHFAGVCPHEKLDITPWAEAAYQHFVRNPLGQRLPRKFKINFSGCATDCGQAMFNDVGVVATTRTHEDGSIEHGFQVFVAGGLGANPHPALALEEFTPRDQLMATIEAVLRVFNNNGNRDNKLRARMKWLVDTMGWDDVQARIIKERRLLLGSSSWPGGIPEEVEKAGDAPAGVADGVTPTVIGQGTPVSITSKSPYDRWDASNVVRGSAKGTVSAVAYARLGDITSAQFRELAAIQREMGLEVRLTNRQNVAFRGLSEDQLTVLHDRLGAIGMAEPGAELARDVVACPGADTCNLAVTQSRGLASAIGEKLESEGLAEVGGLRINISGCTNSCGQHHTSDIGFYGAERRAHGQSAPGYQMLLGGYVGETQVHFGDRALRVPAKAAADATVRVVRRFADERQAGESFRDWLDRSGGAKTIGTELKDLDVFPAPDEGPEFYVDYDETGPFSGEIGEGECAGV
ncbi:MAG TPA: nitrite/sulfite reductase [Acidimicrobiales bacterium]|nr:nitrite/sulfite reductase [Acidimicrobiales bacterium]